VTTEPSVLLVDNRPAKPRQVIGRTACIVTGKAIYPKALIRGYSDQIGAVVLTVASPCKNRTIAVDAADLRPGSRLVHDTPPAPTMIVRVRDERSEAPWGVGLLNPLVRAVTIVATCPVCGGPRGPAGNRNQYDDGAHYSSDVWFNPCGHVDRYAAVLIEAGIHPPRQE
jgi:hypothetical protein